MTPFRLTFFVSAIFFLAAARPLPAATAAEVRIEGVGFEAKSPSHYVVRGTVSNETAESRDLILRAQMTFYDKAAPRGDVPAAVLRKDIAIVLKAGETRALEIPMIEEGTHPKGSFRVEPSIRIRRSREWNY